MRLFLRSALLAGLLSLSPAAPARAQAPAVPDDAGILILVRTAVIALNHANRTGNYTVLRDLGAAGFREANDAARLGQIFADLRGRDLDLAPVAVIEPKLHRRPFIDERGLLRIAGHFPSRPLQVHFDLAWQHTGGRWRLFGISVRPLSATAEPVAAPAPATRPAAATARKPEPVEVPPRKPARQADR